MPPFSLTSRTPGSDKVHLSRAIQFLSESVLENIAGFENAIETTNQLARFGREHNLYADQVQLAKMSSTAALKAWAAERLPSLGISYGFSNRITPELAEQSLNKQAALHIVQFADDLTMIARFCRNVSELSIETLAHSHGIEFRFVIRGSMQNDRFETPECSSLNELLQKNPRNSGFKSEIVATEDRIEARSVLSRAKVRLEN